MMNGPRTEIRRMESGDVEAVSRLEAECFTMPWSEKAFAESLKDEKTISLVALAEGRVVGFGSVMNLLGEGDINNVAVAPAYRGRGIATSLLRELLRQGEAFGIRDFTLEVRVSNDPAIHIYEKLGFVSEGIRPRFYERPVEDALIMWRRPPISISF